MNVQGFFMKIFKELLPYSQAILEEQATIVRDIDLVKLKYTSF